MSTDPNVRTPDPKPQGSSKPPDFRFRTLSV